VGNGGAWGQGGPASVFVDDAAVRLHALDNGLAGSGSPPVLVIPGMGERAEEYAWMLDRLGDRRVVAADLRGRGRSDAPDTGYAWEDHIDDVRRVVESLALDRPILVAFSRGSSYALGYALQFPHRVRGLVVGDYTARHVRPPEAAVERLMRSEIRGVPVLDRIPEHAFRRVFAEAHDVLLWDRLGDLSCEVLVIRGDRRGSLVTDEQAERWRAALPSVQLATVAGAGHDLWSRDVDAYLAALRPFLERIGAV
jgi:pimeloyl-ACP methyl ester carboxylesterase